MGTHLDVSARNRANMLAKWWLTAVFFIFLLGGDSCGSMSVQRPAEESSAPLEFAPPSQLRWVSANDVILRQGREYEQGLPHQNVEAVGASALFTPDCPGPHYPQEGLAFAMYTFGLADYTGEEVLYFGWDSIGDYANGWLGLANYSTDSWDWYPLPQANQIAFDFDEYESPEGQLLIAPIFVETDPWQLAWVRCGTTDVNPGQWFHSWGEDGSECGHDIVVDDSGNVYVGGVTSNAGQDFAGLILKYNAAGDFQWARTLATGIEEHVRSLCLDSDGNVYATGLTYLADSGTKQNVLLVKFNGDGDDIWQRSWGGDDQDWGNAIACDGNDGLYVCGRVDFRDGLILKYTTAGDLVWAKAWGGIQMDEFYGISVDDFGDVYVTGGVRSVGNENPELALLKVSPDGELLFERAWGSERNEYGQSVVVDRTGDICLAGTYFPQGQDFDDSLVIRCDAQGNLLWSSSWGLGGEESSMLRLDSVGNSYLMVYNVGVSKAAVTRIGKYQVATAGWEFSPIITATGDTSHSLVGTGFDFFPNDSIAVLISMVSAQQGSWSSTYMAYEPVVLEEFETDLPLRNAVGADLDWSLTVSDATGVLDTGGGYQDVSVQAFAYPWTS